MPETDPFRLFVEAVKDYAIFMLDPRGHVKTWNVGAERIKGYRADQIIGKHFSIFYPQHEIDAGKCEHELEVAARDGRFEDEGWRLRQDGTRFWASVVITAVRNETGELLGFGKVTRDLTSRVQAEEERIRRARAEESERRKEEFLAIMGHELRNPVAPMVTALHMIKLRRGLNCEKEIAVLERQTAHLTRLLDDLLDLSRTLRGKVRVEPAVIDVGELLSDAIEVATPLVEQKRHRLDCRIEGGPLCVEADRGHLMQVFANVLNNAAKYTDPGGEIRVRAAARGEVVEVVVEDNGIGIAPDALQRVFELFTQGTNVQDRQLGGLGIGLAVARRLLEEHRGEIVAESAGLGKGSRFVVRLPRVIASPARPTRPSEAPSAPRARRRVLLVDDNQDSTEMLRLFLESLGHEVFAAFDGPSGLELAARVKPDVALLDLGLPGMTGYEVAGRMRQLPGCETIPIIAVSGYARESDREASKKAGFSAHFAKPFDLELLESVVDRAAV